MLLPAYMSSAPVNEEIALLLDAFTLGAVNCYALISGYVGYGRKVRYSNILHLCLTVLFYTLSLPLIMTLLCGTSFSKSDLITAIVPMLRGSYWYFIAYFALFFFTPFLNILVEKADRKDLKKLIITIVIMFSFVPTFLFTDIANVEYGYAPLWLAALYIIGAYIKKYSVTRSIKACLLSFLACSVGTWLFRFIVSAITTKIFGAPRFASILYNYTSPTILFGAVMLLLLFTQLKFPKGVNKFIAIASPLAFSVYIIHIEPHVFTYFIKNTMCNLSALNPVVFALAIIGIALAIYIICSLIDLIRFYLFKVLRIKKLCEKTEDFLASKLKKFLN